MKKRLPTSIAILVFTIGFVLLRQFSLLFFDAFVFAIMLGSIIEMVKVNKKQGKRIDSILLFLVPVIEVIIFNLTSGKYWILLNLAFCILSILYLLTPEIVIYGKNRKSC